MPHSSQRTNKELSALPPTWQPACLRSELDSSSRAFVQSHPVVRTQRFTGEGRCVGVRSEDCECVHRKGLEFFQGEASLSQSVACLENSGRSWYPTPSHRAGD